MEALHGLQSLLLALVWVAMVQPTHCGGDVHIRPGGLGVQPGAPYSLTRRTKASLIRVSHLGPVWVRVHGHAQIAIHALIKVLMGSIIRVHVGLGLLCRGVGIHGSLVGVKVIMHGGVLSMALVWVLECVTMMTQALQRRHHHHQTYIADLGRRNKLMLLWHHCQAMSSTNCITQRPEMQSNSTEQALNLNLSSC